MKIGRGKRRPRRGKEMNALLMDAQTLLRKEECAEGTGLRPNYATVMDAQIESSQEECALGMVQRSKDMNARLMDALIGLFKGDCA